MPKFPSGVYRANAYVEKALLIINVLPGFDLHQRVASFTVVSFVTDLNFELFFFSCFAFSASDADKIPEEQEIKEEVKEETKEPEGLKILTDASFDTFLAQTEHVMVMFYAPCKCDVFLTGSRECVALLL